MLGELKKFLARGNVVDMAVGIIIGAAFGDIVKGLVDWVIMPPIGLLTSGIDFNEQYISLKDPPGGGTYKTVDEFVKAGGVALRYGSLLNKVLTFLIVAIAVFLLVKVVQRLQKPSPDAPPPEPSASEKLLAEIRDLLKTERR
jgi:large conductance mechanosensitive channel